MIRLTVTGACGRMGSAILRLAALDPDFTIAHILEVKGHPLAGQYLTVPGVSGRSFLVEDDVRAAISDSDVVIDFTRAEASLVHFDISVDERKAIVVGTTGISPDLLAKMKATPGARAVISPNMSVGVNVLFSLVRKAAEIIGNDYDTEIVELHHNLKKDAPSGTALKLKDVITGVAPDRNWIEVTGREGLIGERVPDEIGVMSVRAGDIVGEHTVYFVGTGERLEITHRAYSRDNFARGSLVAAKWIADREEGVYDMSDVLGLARKK